MLPFQPLLAKEYVFYNCNQLDNKFIVKAGRLDFYEERPASLVYFEHCFHLLDMQVLYSYASDLYSLIS